MIIKSHILSVIMYLLMSIPIDLVLTYVSIEAKLFKYASLNIFLHMPCNDLARSAAFLIRNLEEL